VKLYVKESVAEPSGMLTEIAEYREDAAATVAGLHRLWSETTAERAAVWIWLHVTLPVKASTWHGWLDGSESKTSPNGSITDLVTPAGVTRLVGNGEIAGSDAGSAG
jgi:hypothetical protein